MLPDPVRHDIDYSCPPRAAEQLNADTSNDTRRSIARKNGGRKRDHERSFCTLQRRPVTIVIVVVITSLAVVLFSLFCKPTAFLFDVSAMACV
jgi:hypothetical protein